MRVALISPYSQIEAIGLRILSSTLKRSGFETCMLFLPDINEMMVGVNYGERKLSPAVRKQIINVCADTDLIGISLMTTSFLLARDITLVLKKELKQPIIWGGVHPTVRPRECLKFCDLVCIGEAENTLLALANSIERKETYQAIPNLGFLDKAGNLVLNPLNKLDKNLDGLPFPDYDFKNHYILHENQVTPLSADLIYYYLTDLGSWAQGPVYGILTTRGCPYHCTYCVNDALTKIYPEWCKLRKRSPENVISEIQSIRARLPLIQAINIRDDTFFANSDAYIEAFSQLYKEQVKLPFRAYTTAQTINQAKLSHLVSAGLRFTIMGIQTGSENTRKLYHRQVSNDQALHAAQLIHSYQAQVPRPMYDVITDNPYENEADKFQTLQLVNRLPFPYRLSLFALTFYPGTALFEQAKKDGLIKEDDVTIYRRNFQIFAANYYNFVLFCHGLNFPKPLLNLLSRRNVFRVLNTGPGNLIFGGMLSLLLRLRLGSNRRLYAKRRGAWLSNRPFTEDAETN